MAGFNIDLSGLGQLATGIGSAAKDIRTAITGKAILDPTAQAELEEKLAAIDASVMNAQAAINQAEAVSPNLFIAGWRPAIGWVCVIALIYNFLAEPLMKTFGLNAPTIQMQDLIGLLVGMLGLAGARTVEKINNAESNR